MNNYLLFIDTESSGLPKKWNAPYSQENNWPHCVQLAWVIYTLDGTQVKEENHYIGNDDFKIQLSATKIHGITREFLNNEGEDRVAILNLLKTDIERYHPLIIGHFIELDFHVLSADYYRTGIENPLKNLPMFCTMIATKGFITNRPVKYLKLFHLYDLLFNKTLAHKHDAIVDARATAECFFELIKRGDLTVEDIETQDPLKQINAKAAGSGCSMVLMIAVFITMLIFYFL